MISSLSCSYWLAFQKILVVINAMNGKVMDFKIMFVMLLMIYHVPVAN